MLVSEWVNDNIDKINFDNVKQGLKELKKECGNMEDVLLQTAWIETESDLTFEEFITANKVN